LLRIGLRASDYLGFAAVCIGIPSRISSVARWTTVSPAARLPRISTKSPQQRLCAHRSIRPVRNDLNHKSSLGTVVVTTLVFGTNNAGRECRTGHFTVGNIPGARDPPRLATSSSTASYGSSDRVNGKSARQFLRRFARAMRVPEMEP